MPRERILILTEPEIKELKRKGFSVRYRVPAHDGKPESKSPWRKYREAKSERQAKRMAEEYRQELEDEINDCLSKPDISLASYARRWHEDRKDEGEIKQSTWLREESIIISIENSKLGEKPMCEIRVSDIDQFKRDGQKAGWSKDKQAKTLRKLKQILKFAESRGVIEYDPSRNVKNIKSDPAERRSLTREDQKKILDAVYEEKPDGHRAAVLLALATGLREGELLGLHWGDVDLKAGGNSVLHLRKQLGRSGELEAPKHDGTGDLPIDDDTAAWLSAWKRQVAQSMGKKRSEIQDVPICCNAKWGYLSHSNLARWWRKFIVDHELGTFGNVYVKPDKSGRNQKHFTEFEGYKFHELRHTVGTELVGSGADLRTVQAIMRHKSIRSTEPYLHSINENMVEAVGKVAKKRREYDPEKEKIEQKRKVTDYSVGSHLPHNPEWN